jgi:hypothetical protein
MIRAFYIFIFLLEGLTSCTETEIQTIAPSNEINSSIAPDKVKDEITWEDLKFDSLTELWSDEYQAIYMVPNFNNKTKKLNGERISITGYFITVGVLSDYYILSKVEIFGNQLFNNDHPDQRVDIIMHMDQPPSLNEKVTINGILTLNKDDILQLNYILKDAKIVKN